MLSPSESTLNVEIACSVVPPDKPTRCYSPVDRTLHYTYQHRPNDNELPDGMGAGYLPNTLYNLSHMVCVKLKRVS
jgi:hypothetical protein